jgi:hypothetical protein
MRIDYIIYKDRPYDSMVKLKRIIIIIIIIINIIFVRFVVHSFHFLSLPLSLSLYALLSLAYAYAYTHTLPFFSRRVSQRANEQTEDRWRKKTENKRRKSVVWIKISKKRTLSSLSLPVLAHTYTKHTNENREESRFS